jgi:hypothetical protein
MIIYSTLLLTCGNIVVAGHRGHLVRKEVLHAKTKGTCFAKFRIFSAALGGPGLEANGGRKRECAFQEGCRGFESRLPLQLQIEGIPEQDPFDF